MPKNRLASFGTTTLEQVPSEFGGSKDMHHKPWALFIIIFIGIIFGTFWVYERRLIRSQIPPTQTLSPKQSSSTLPSSFITDLQASVLNTSIPDFSTNF